MTLYCVDDEGTYVSGGGASTDPASSGDWTGATIYPDLQTVFDDNVVTGADLIKVSDEHVESTAGNKTYTVDSVAPATPIPTICVDYDDTSVLAKMRDAASPGRIATTAGGDLIINGNFYAYGLNFVSNDIFRLGAAATHAIGTFQHYDNCFFELDASAAADFVQITSASENSIYRFTDVDWKFSHVDQRLEVRGDRGGAILFFVGGSIDSGGSAITKLFTGTEFSTVHVAGMDLSHGPTSSLFNDTIDGGIYYFNRCKVNAGIDGNLIGSIFTTDQLNTEVIMRHCHSGTPNKPTFEYAGHNYFGKWKADTAQYRDDGASTGETQYSIALTALANSTTELYAPVRMKLGSVWVDGDGTSKTITVYLTGAAYDDDEAWIDLEYPNETESSNGSLAALKSSRAGLLATPAALTSSAKTWNVTSGVEQEIALSIAPDEPGYVDVWINFSTGSGSDLTINVCPKFDVT